MEKWRWRVPGSRGDGAVVHLGEESKSPTAGEASSEWIRLATPVSTDSSGSDPARDPAGDAATPLADSFSAAELPKHFLRQESDTSICSLATSAQLYADPGQTLIFFDWDDTLFPYSALFDGWKQRGVLLAEAADDASRKHEAELAAWREALYQYLSVACSLSDRCTIVTNAKRPWVTYCVERFAPNLRPMFERAAGGLNVVYAGETLPASEAKGKSESGVRPGSDLDHLLRMEERSRQLTAAKLFAMRSEATQFYSRYPQQTWKNILSLGDMKYEHDAVHELSSSRKSLPRERLRTKAILLPRRPSLSELTLRLKFSRLMLPAYVRFNGDVDLDLRRAADPLQAIARALGMPQLGDLPFPRHAWGRTPVPEEQVATDALDEVAMTLHDLLAQEDEKGSPEDDREPRRRAGLWLPPPEALWRLAEGAAAAVATSVLGGGAAQGDLVDLVHSAYTLAVSFAAVTTLHECQELVSPCPSAGSASLATGCGGPAPAQSARVWVLKPWAERAVVPMLLRSVGFLLLDASHVLVSLATTRQGPPHLWRQRLLRCAVQSAMSFSCLAPGPGARLRLCFPTIGFLAEASSAPLRLALLLRRAPAAHPAPLLLCKVTNMCFCWYLIWSARRHLDASRVRLQLALSTCSHALSAFGLYAALRGLSEVAVSGQGQLLK